MPEENPHRRSGQLMLWMAWLLVLGSGWWAADHWLAHEENPNQVVRATNGGEVVLVPNRGGHYVADGEINGRRVTFMLDTGASTVAMSTQLARELGLKRGAPMQLSTANGLAIGFQTRLDVVRLGPIEVRNVSAVFSDSMLEDTVLLGMSFLKQVEFTQRGNQLTLRSLQQ